MNILKVCLVLACAVRQLPTRRLSAPPCVAAKYQAKMQRDWGQSAGGARPATVGGVVDDSEHSPGGGREAQNGGKLRRGAGDTPRRTRSE